MNIELFKFSKVLPLRSLNILSIVMKQQWFIDLFILMERINATMYLILVKASVILVSAMFLGPHPYTLHIQGSLHFNWQLPIASAGTLPKTLSTHKVSKALPPHISQQTSTNDRYLSVDEGNCSPTSLAAVTLRPVLHFDLKFPSRTETPLCTVGTFQVVQWLTGFLSYPLHRPTGAS